jgi:hypothetical protein
MAVMSNTIGPIRRPAETNPPKKKHAFGGKDSGSMDGFFAAAGDCPLCLFMAAWGYFGFSIMAGMQSMGK